MVEAKQHNDLAVLGVSDLIVMALSFGVALLVSGQATQPDNIDGFLAARVKLQNFIFFLGYALIWHLVFRFFGLYKAHRQALLTSEWCPIFKAVAVALLILTGLSFVLQLSAVNLVFVASFFATALVASIIIRTAIRRSFEDVRRNGRPLRNLVIVGCGPKGAACGRDVRARPELGYLLLGFVDDIPPPENPQHGGREKLLGSLAEATQIITSSEVDEVIVALPIKSCYDLISRIISIGEEIGLPIRVPADFFDSHHSIASMDVESGRPMVTFTTRAPDAVCSGMKRVVDALASLVGCAVLLPLFALVALAIKLESKGSVFFAQDRVGLGRKTFRILKFRSMVVDAEDRQAALDDTNEVAGAAFKIAEDPRVTRVGRVIRKLSIDELPQLLNVLRGDMSLVGPRPLPIRDVERFDQNWLNRRFSVKPGLTCLWQVNGRHQIDFDHWMELDLEYIDNWSLSLDFDILVKTVPAVLRGAGAS